MMGRRGGRRTGRRTARRVSRRQAGTQAPPPAQAAAAPVQPAAQPAPPGDDYAAELQQLASLKEQGLITDEEFQAKKKRILGI